MRWKSTVEISREQAISLIETNMDLDNMSNNKLSLLLEAVLSGENHGYNYVVCSRPNQQNLQNRG